MRAANIVAGLVAAAWYIIFLMGRGIIDGVYMQGPGSAPNAGQFDYYVVYPLIAAALVMLTGWVGNAWRKPGLTLIPALVVGFALLPFLLGYTGGM